MRCVFTEHLVKQKLLVASTVDRDLQQLPCTTCYKNSCNNKWKSCQSRC